MGRIKGDCGVIYEFKEQTAELDAQFAEYLEGKTVAIVGRSCLDDIKQGEFIDSHDIVVRLHWVVPYTSDDDTSSQNNKRSENDPVKAGEFVPRSWHPIIGKRVDVFYHRVEHKNKPEYYNAWLEVFRRSGGKWLCYDGHRGTGHWQTHYMQQYAPVRYVSWSLKGAVVCEIEQKAEAGTIVIADMLRHNIKSAYITGFPCMMDAFITNESPYSFGKKAHTESGSISPSGFANLKFVYRLCQDSKVKVDRNMSILFRKHEKGELYPLKTIKI